MCCNTSAFVGDISYFLKNVWAKIWAESFRGQKIHFSAHQAFEILGQVKKIVIVFSIPLELHQNVYITIRIRFISHN